MTTKQMYAELAKIAGFTCASGETFARTTLLSESELRRAQNSILALLDKLNYMRTSRDFPISPAYARRLQQSEAQRGSEIRLADIAAATQLMRSYNGTQTQGESVQFVAPPQPIQMPQGRIFTTSWSDPFAQIDGRVSGLGEFDPHTDPTSDEE